MSDAVEAYAAGGLRYVGHLGGASNALALRDGYALLGVGPRLVVLDVSDPARPSALAQTDPLEGVVGGIAVAEPYAYLGLQRGLLVLDLAEPTRPQRLGFLPSEHSIHSVALAGALAYLAVGGPDGGVLAVDVSDPALPVGRGFVSTPGEPYAVRLRGGLAYVATVGHRSIADRLARREQAPREIGGLCILDVADPDVPREVGFVAPPVGAWDVALDGGYAYLASPHYKDETALRVVDVSDPTAPRLVGGLASRDYAVRVAVAGGRAYVASLRAGLLVADLADPTNPTRLGAHPTANAPGAVAVAGRHAFLAAENGLHVLDVLGPDGPVEVGHYWTAGPAFDVDSAGPVAYVAGHDVGLSLVDVAEPLDPRVLGRLPLSPRETVGVAASGGLAYVAHESKQGLRVVDVSELRRPREVGAFEVPVCARGLALDGTRVYLAANYDGLFIVDVSDPEHPARLSHAAVPQVAFRVAVAHGLAFTTGTGGLHAFDVSDPRRPVEVDAYAEFGDAWLVAVAGNFMYLAYRDYERGDEQGGLRILEISNPLHPVAASFLRIPWAFGLAVAGDVAYVGDAKGGVHMVDVSDRARPRVVGLVRCAGAAVALKVAGSLLYAACDDGGLYVLARSPAPDPGGHEASAG